MTATRSPTIMASRSATASNVPLGSKNQPTAPSPRNKRPASDKSFVATRDNLNSKVVSKPAAFKNPARRQLAATNSDNVATALGQSNAVTPAGGNSMSTSFSSPMGVSGGGTSPGAANRPLTANKQYQLALKQGELDIGARRKRIAVTGQIGSTAGLGGDPSGNSTTPTPAGRRVLGSSSSASAATAAADGRAAAGVPSGRMTGISSVTDANGERRPVSANVLRKNSAVEGAAGASSADAAKRLDRFHKKNINAQKVGETYNNVLGGSSSTPMAAAASNNNTNDGNGGAATTPELRVSRRFVEGRSNVSPFRGGVSPMRVPKPYATTDDLPPTAPLPPSNGTLNSTSAAGGGDVQAAGFMRTTSASRFRHTSPSHRGVHQTQQGSLVGVFKPDTSLIKQRAANHVAPWDRKEAAPAPSGRGAVPVGSSSARQSHMGGVFTVADAAVSPTGAAVGSSNVMARGNSPFRGGAAPSPTAGGAAVRAASAQRAVSPYATGGGDDGAQPPVRRVRSGVFTPSATQSSARPVWAMSPRAEPQRPAIGATSFRRVATAAPAPWATD